MSVLKKFLSGVIAVAMLTSIPLLNISADYDCDVNDDGVVSSSDMAAISRYLAGNLYEPNYNKFDVNNSLTVDNMDIQCVLAERMDWNYDCDYISMETHQYSNAPNVSTFIPNSASNTTGYRDYFCYSYEDNGSVSEYRLFPSTDTLSTINSRVIIGTDDRYLSRGEHNCGIVRLENNGNCGTGFIIDDHHIATAAHCVYGKESNAWAEDLQINTYDVNGNMLSTTLTPVEIHIPELYTLNYNSGYYDYALITVEENLSNYFQFDLATSYSLTAANFSNIPVYVTGRPGTTPEEITNGNDYIYTSEGRVIDRGSEVYRYAMTLDADATKGQSGAPIYTITRNIINGQPSYSYSAIAIYSKGAIKNSGTLITKYQLQFYRNNSYASY